MTRRSTGIASVLEKEILSNIFVVGEVINEVAVAERLGVSRKPVREACSDRLAWPRARTWRRCRRRAVTKNLRVI